MAQTEFTGSSFLNKIRENAKTKFEASKRVLSFEDYLDWVLKNPARGIRHSPLYIIQAINHFGTESLKIRSQTVKRFKIFDQNFEESATPIVGQEEVQNQIYRLLTGFVRSGASNKLILLHGPNGSAKSSLIRALFAGVENYSSTDDGALYCFSWVFPNETLEKTSLGIGAKRDPMEGLESFANLEPERIGAIVRSELHENPLFLIPKDWRLEMFNNWLQKASASEKEHLLSAKDQFLGSELSHKNALIFEALLNEYKGDYKKVLRHIRVERYFLNRRFRRGLVTVEPQLSVDASIRQVTLDKSMANLPPSLHSLNLFQLEGDLIDGNRGIIEYDDLLKRPLEHFKYLITTCETGSVNLAHVVAHLDNIFLASSNDRQLEAFREHPDYNSFKARLELIKVPYLLRYSDEEKIYKDTAQRSAGTKEMLPHTTKVLALWAVLTRLKKPILKNKSNLMIRLLESLTPLEKAKLYNHGEIPERFNDEERRELRVHTEELVREHQDQPYYEGLLGASARELKAVLKMAAQNEDFPTFGPNAVFEELKKLVKRPMDYEFLRQEPIHGYHDFAAHIDIVKNEWLDWVDDELKGALNLQEEWQLEEFLENYVRHATAFVRKEKIKNRITGQAEDPNKEFMEQFEAFIGLHTDKEEFRKNLISRLGAWSLENPGKKVGKDLPYSEVFTDLLEKLKTHFHKEQKGKIKAMGAFITDVATFDVLVTGQEKVSESAAMALKAYQGLQIKFGYGPQGAKEALTALIKARYV